MKKILQTLFLLFFLSIPVTSYAQEKEQLCIPKDTAISIITKENFVPVVKGINEDLVIEIYYNYDTKSMLFIAYKAEENNAISTICLLQVMNVLKFDEDTLKTIIKKLGLPV